MWEEVSYGKQELKENDQEKENEKKVSHQVYVIF